MKTLHITLDEIINLIEDVYCIKDVKFMASGHGEADHEIFDTPIYISGELKAGELLITGEKGIDPTPAQIPSEEVDK